MSGVSNGILYGLIFAEDLDDDRVVYVANGIVDEPAGYLTTEETYAEIADALASDETLTEGIPGHSHSEMDFRDFLARVVRRLDEMRPWPERPFQVLNPLSWDDPDSARLVARVKVSVLNLEPRLHGTFRRSGDGRRVLTLRLLSGVEVALVLQWWPGSMDTALLMRDPSLPVAEVLEEFLAATGITRDEITTDVTG